MLISFTKYSGCGNDFILIDNRSLFFSSLPKKISRLCHRQNGIGADGVILLESSSTADFRMRIFNADGSEAEMCGNGIRCLARFIHDLGFKQPEFIIETLNAAIPVIVNENHVSVKMPSPTGHCFSHELSIHEKLISFHYLDTGVPHTVLFVENIQEDSHLALAPALRHHPHFTPKGTNVNFAEILKDNSVAVRTYERGVEQETLACGTGAVAVAIAAAEIHQLKSPIAIHTRSKDLLHISFDGSATNPKDLIMSGPAIKIFHGHIEI